MEKSRQLRTHTGKNFRGHPVQFLPCGRVQVWGIPLEWPLDWAHCGWFNMPLLDNTYRHSYLKFVVTVHHQLCADLQKKRLLGWWSPRSPSLLGTCAGWVTNTTASLAKWLCARHKLHTMRNLWADICFLIILVF